MNNNKLLLATIAGGIVYFLLGWVVYGILLADFMKNNAGSASGVMREEIVLWALLLGNLVFAFLLAYIFTRWANIHTPGGGAMAGFVIGLLVAASIDLMMYGTSNVLNMTGMIVDVVAAAIISSITGAIIGWVLGTGKKTAVA